MEDEKYNIFEILLKRKAKYINKKIYCLDDHEIIFNHQKILNGFWCNTIKYYNEESSEFKYFDILDKERKIIIHMDLFSLEENKEFEKYKIWVYKNEEERKKLFEDYDYLIRIEKETFDIDKLENSDLNFKIITYEGSRKDCSSFKKENKNPNTYNRQSMIGYVRVSTDYQVEDGNSIENQQHIIKKDAEDNDMYLKALYIDAGISGKHTKRRTALNNMIIEANNDFVVFTEISRLSRNFPIMLELIKKLRDKKCKVKDIDKGKVYGETADGDFIFHLHGMISEMESSRISSKVKSGMKILNSRGLLPKKPKYGYKRGENHENIVDEEEMKIINKVISLRKRFSNLSRNQFYNYLNNIHLTTLRKSSSWNHKNAGKILDEAKIP